MANEPYVVAAGSSERQLAAEVEAFMARGYVPDGGVACGKDGRLYQSLVLPKPVVPNGEFRLRESGLRMPVNVGK